MDKRADKPSRLSLADFSFADHLALWIGCVALLGGIGVLALAHGSIKEVLGVPLLGLCGVAWFFLILLLIGEGEERDRRHGRS